MTKEGGFSSCVQLPLNAARLTEALVCLNTHTKGWTTSRTCGVLNGSHKTAVTTFDYIFKSQKTFALINNHLKEWNESGMNINMLKNDFPSKNSTCLSVSGSRGVAHAANIHYLICQHAPPLASHPKKKVQSGLNVITALCSWQWQIAHLGTIRFGHKKCCNCKSRCAASLVLRPQKLAARFVHLLCACADPQCKNWTPSHAD